MSREIKFRAWSKKANRYLKITGIQYDGDEIAGVFVVYGTIAGIPNTIFIESDDVVVLEQYTGLKDKNGKEIYEGDIMRYDAIDYKVLWADYYAGFETKRLNSPYNNAGLTLHFLASVGRVIGNIHENPELLGGEK